MSQHPVAAGKSSFDHVDPDLVFEHVLAHDGAAYLDLACGAGRYTLALAGRVGNGSVIHALDLWEEGVKTLADHARNHGIDSIRAGVADMTRRLPLEDRSIDVCLVATVLHDLPEDARDGVIQEVWRVLVPQGTLAVIEFKKLDHGPGPRRDRRIGPEEADALVLVHGFERKADVDLGEFTYLATYSRA